MLAISSKVRLRGVLLTDRKILLILTSTRKIFINRNRTLKIFSKFFILRKTESQTTTTKEESQAISLTSIRLLLSWKNTMSR